MPGNHAGNDGLRVVARVGSFRGFGGLFTEPPLIASNESDDFFVRSGHGCWLLTSDAFGETFHRASVAEFEATKLRPWSLSGVRLHGSIMEWCDQLLELPVRGEITSTAVNANTFAVTSSLTHAIALIAFPPVA